MATVMSPPLRLDGAVFRTNASQGSRPWFFLNDLMLHFHFPLTAKTYWIALSDRQFADRSGHGYRMEFTKCGTARIKPSGAWFASLSALDRHLRKLDVTNKPTTIYVCLWYE